MARDPWQDERLVRFLAAERGRLRRLVPPGGTASGPPAPKVWIPRRVSRGDEVPIDLLDAVAQGPVFLQGPPGAGCSSTLRWLGWQVADPVANEVTARLGHRVPIHVDLGETPIGGFDEAMAQACTQQGGAPLEQALHEALSDGSAVVMVDGVDEARAAAIARATERWKECTWLVTGVVAPRSFGAPWILRPLDADESKRLGQAWAAWRRLPLGAADHADSPDVLGNPGRIVLVTCHAADGSLLTAVDAVTPPAIARAVAAVGAAGWAAHGALRDISRVVAATGACTIDGAAEALALLDRHPGLLDAPRGGRFTSAALEEALAVRTFVDAFGSADRIRTRAALALLGRQVREVRARPVLGAVIEGLVSKPEALPHLVRRLFGIVEKHSLPALDELGRLSRWMCDETPLNPAAIDVLATFERGAVRRWVAEGRRVPRWTRELGDLDDIDLLGLDASEVPDLVDLRPLRALRSLRRLDLHDSAGVRDLGPLANLRRLEWLDLHGLSGVSDLAPIGRLSRLRWLDLGGCHRVTDLSSLAGLADLEALALHGCRGIGDLDVLGGMRRLRALVISDCPDIFDLDPLRRLPAGGIVWVRGTGVRVIPTDLNWEVVGMPGG